MMVNQAWESLLEVLKGYGRRDTAALDQLAQIPVWQRVAQAELERRATSIVQVLDDETLRAIASGKIDFQAACRDAASKLTSKSA
jgi:hypothetical protein